MKYLVDTNVILDVLLGREPFVHASSRVLAEIERGDIQGVVAATSVTTIHYLSSKAVGREKAGRYIRQLLSLFEVASVNRKVLVAALESSIEDYEDAVLSEAGRTSGVEAIITRDARGFIKSDLPSYSPEEYLSGRRTLE